MDTTTIVGTSPRKRTPALLSLAAIPTIPLSGLARKYAKAAAISPADVCRAIVEKEVIKYSD
jgi:hypothetical protein